MKRVNTWQDVTATGRASIDLGDGIVLKTPLDVPAALDGKAGTTHGHAWGEVTGKPAVLSTITTAGGVPAAVLGAVDANTVTEPGNYFISSANVQAAPNWPNTTGGHVTVIGLGPNQMDQTYRVQSSTGSAVFYARTRTAATVWSPWRVYSSQRVDNTAGRCVYTWDNTANREQLVYGDTGVRSLAAPAGTSGTINLRRSGNTVFFKWVAFTNTAGGTLTLPLFPAGFRAPAFTNIPSLPYWSSETEFRARTTGADLQVYAYTAGGVTNFIGTWDTWDPWPTTLPGTAVGALPA